MDSISGKKKLRHQVRKVLSLIESSVRLDQQQMITDSLSLILKQLTVGLSHIKIGLYSPFEFEIDIRQVHFPSTCRYEFAFPEFGGRNPQGVISYLALDGGLDSLPDDPSWVRDSHEKMKPVTPDIIFVPGLAFTPTGQRLGRGKGYFDRYLNDFSGISISPSYHQQIFEGLPWENHDRSVDFIVTDRATFFDGSRNKLSVRP